MKPLAPANLMGWLALFVWDFIYRVLQEFWVISVMFASCILGRLAVDCGYLFFLVDVLGFLGCFLRGVS